MFHRSLVFLVAAALPLLFVGQVAPNMARELDFWLLWLAAMVLVGLPVLFAEVALSARSAATPWQGMQSLTREADASVMWRAFAVVSVLASLLMAANISARIGAGVVSQLPDVATNIGAPDFALAAMVAVLMLILSLLKSRLLPVGVLLVLVGAVIALLDNSVSVPVLTTITTYDAARAVLLALLCVGVGTGLYWFGATGIAPQLMAQKRTLTSFILPVWFVQLIFGAFALLAGSALIGLPSFIVSSLGLLLIAAFLVYYAAQQLIARFGMVIGVLATVLLLMAFSLVPAKFLLIALSALALIGVLLLAIFTGFVMKISHLRKTLNFTSELRYNLWRVLVRIIVPLFAVLALVGLIIEWIGL